MALAVINVPVNQFFGENSQHPQSKIPSMTSVDTHLNTSSATALHKIADVFRLNASSDEWLYVVVAQFLQLHTHNVTETRGHLKMRKTSIRDIAGKHLKLKPKNPPYRSLSFVSFKIHYMDFPDCLLLLLSISVFLLFSFFCFYTFLVVGSVR